MRIDSRFLFLFLMTLCLGWIACDKDEPENPTLTLLSISADGTPLVDRTINVATEVTFELVFSTAIEAASFESAFALSSSMGTVNEVTISYANAASKVVIEVNDLLPSTEYTLRVSAGMLGQNNAMLAQAVERRFTTRDVGLITELPPCISASDDCLSRITLTDGGAQGIFTAYSSFPLELENARWENLTSAIIVVHGQNRNADDYFSYMMSSLRAENWEEQTLLVAPYFQSASTAQSDEISWSGSSWREGQNSGGPASISSFTAIDQILSLLGDKSRFPVLETVIVTGHSSGALFTHVYAAANAREEALSDLDFHYLVANSQYFYYPSELRYDGDSNQFLPVTDCPGYDQWPYGYASPPDYLTGTDQSTVDQRIVERSVTYLLGDQDVVTTGTLNTSDCAAVVLGENRFQRGENIFLLLETYFPSTFQAEKVIVPGVGHNAQGMYQSQAFKTWLLEKL